MTTSFPRVKVLKSWCVRSRSCHWTTHNLQKSKCLLNTPTINYIVSDVYRFEVTHILTKHLCTHVLSRGKKQQVICTGLLKKSVVPFWTRSRSSMKPEHISWPYFVAKCVAITYDLTLWNTVEFCIQRTVLRSEWKCSQHTTIYVRENTLF